MICLVDSKKIKDHAIITRGNIFQSNVIGAYTITVFIEFDVSTSVSDISGYIQNLIWSHNLCVIYRQ